MSLLDSIHPLARGARGSGPYRVQPLLAPVRPLRAARVAALRPAREEAVPGEARAFHGLVGGSPAMRAVYHLLARAAAVDATVLLGGETGTGKELAARAIHDHGLRTGQPFVAVNCGAIPAELIESELFGHARGAFTGAAGARTGLFEEAQAGTIFLDEVGELPLPLQVKLNRVLQEKEVRRVGGSAPVKLDVRVIAATHRDLRQEVKAGRFREDLYYRVSVFPIMLPALRERGEDLPLLAAHLLEKHARAHRRDVDGLEPEAMALLRAWPWPGNVRELENAIERAIAVAGATRIRAEDLPPELRVVAATAAWSAASSYREALDQARYRASHDYLVALLTEFRGNVTRAAERAALERESLHRLLHRHGLSSGDFKR